MPSRPKVIPSNRAYFTTTPLIIFILWLLRPSRSLKRLTAGYIGDIKKPYFLIKAFAIN
jgi:hypothetical protein